MGISRVSGQRFRFYLYNNFSGDFAEIRDGTVCGRNDGEIIFPDDNLLSRKHCRFRVVGNDVYVEDLGSTNKTSVNTVPIRSLAKRRLLLNDVIEMGSQRFVLTMQNKYPPANIQDAHTTRIYKAMKRPDGSLTRAITGLITKHTLVRLDRRKMREMKVKRVEKTITRYSWALALGVLLAAIGAGWHVWTDGGF